MKNKKGTSPTEQKVFILAPRNLETLQELADEIPGKHARQLDRVIEEIRRVGLVTLTNQNPNNDDTKDEKKA